MREKQKELGQFFTDPIIARYMVDLAYFDEAENLLDPAVGQGVFLQCMEERKNHCISYTALDIDSKMVDKLKENNDIDVKLLHEDYLFFDADEKFDIIICNPPYNKFQEIPRRNEYIVNFENKYNIKISGYSNLCVYFLIKSLNELNVNGKCVYIIPYEFMNAGYGNVIKQYLLDTKMLKSIIKFDSTLNLFADALTTSCIIVCENKEHKNIDFVSVNSIDEIETRSYSNAVTKSYTDIIADEKWNKYFENAGKEAYLNLVDFSSAAKVKRGIATGSNEFFSISKSQINDFELSENVCIRCIAKSADIKVPVFTDDEFQKLDEANKKVYLFDGSKATGDSDYEYIKLGEKKGVNKTFLNSHRNPWYAPENKDAAPIWISVFSRNKIKIVRNETSAKNLTTFHSVFTKNCDRIFQNVFFCYLITPIAQQILYENKRDYGNGLDKFEPNDLNNSKILDLSLLSDDDENCILHIYEEIKENGLTDKYIDDLNSIFSFYLFNRETVAMERSDGNSKS